MYIIPSQLSYYLYVYMHLDAYINELESSIRNPKTLIQVALPLILSATLSENAKPLYDFKVICVKKKIKKKKTSREDVC